LDVAAAAATAGIQPLLAATGGRKMMEGRQAQEAVHATVQAL